MKTILAFMAIVSALLTGCVGYDGPYYGGGPGRYEGRHGDEGERHDHRGDSDHRKEREEGERRNQRGDRD